MCSGLSSKAICSISYPMLSGYVLDVIILFGRVVASLSPLLQLPVEARGKARGANQPRRVFQEGVVVQDADTVSPPRPPIH